MTDEQQRSDIAVWSRTTRGKILIVEPDADIARMLEVRLAREGHDILLAETAAAAQTLAEEEQVHLALVDRGVPNALELIGTLKEKLKPFEGLLMSVDSSTEYIVEALNQGAYDVITKPFPHLKLITHQVGNALAKVLAERDRNELTKLLHAQTQDIAKREVQAERLGNDEEEPLSTEFDLDNITGIDPLTGLPNRRAAEERFRKETARALRYDRPLCVAMASIDGLEEVLEKHGAAVTDGVLRGITSMFTGLIRDVDFLARKQGGEFLFIFPETPKESGGIVVERIREKLEETSFSQFVDVQGGEFKLTVSFGVAGLPTDTMNAAILQDAAEAALRRAQERRNQVVLFDGQS